METENKQEVQNFSVETPDDIVKRPIVDILSDAKAIDLKKISNEILQWTCDNVENFIDNQNKIFKLDLVVNSEDMPEIQRLQDLYKAIPEDEPDNSKKMEEITECRKSLNAITDSIFDAMRENSEMLEKLFKRMIYFYEMIGVKNGVPVIRELEGKVTIDKFEYDAFTVPVKLMKNITDDDGNTIEKVVTKQYIIPEGFTLWLTIHFHTVQKQTSVF